MTFFVEVLLVVTRKRAMHFFFNGGLQLFGLLLYCFYWALVSLRLLF